MRNKMDKEKLKLIVRNLKQIVDALESEVLSDVDAYKYDNYNDQILTDYDEVFEDDDG
tara:strand:- start:376 stop:549 length:174 start_codon:yes stop_codon:yes gene_type:complete